MYYLFFRAEFPELKQTLELEAFFSTYSYMRNQFVTLFATYMNFLKYIHFSLSISSRIYILQRQKFIVQEWIYHI